jgi:hypothetical protein
LFSPIQKGLGIRPEAGWEGGYGCGFIPYISLFSLLLALSFGFRPNPFREGFLDDVQLRGESKPALGIRSPSEEGDLLELAMVKPPFPFCPQAKMEYR